MQPLVSIIIPVYNVEEYLQRCIESVLAQTIQEWEMILIDDGSTDGSGNMIDFYQDMDKRIRAIHIENTGVSNARNLGLKAMHGKYACFLDGDDWWSPAYLEVMLHKALESGADMVQCGYWKAFCRGNQVKCNSTEAFALVGREKILLEYFNGNILPNVWSKIFLADKVKNIAFKKDLCFGEDALFTFEFCCSALHIEIIPDNLYFYYQRELSITHQKFGEQNFQLLTRFDIFYQKLDKHEAAYYACVKSEVGKCLWLLRKINSEKVCLNKRPILRKRLMQHRQEIFCSSGCKLRTKLIILLLWICPSFSYILMSIFKL